MLSRSAWPSAPYATGGDVLFVAFYASAELVCYRVLGWPMPERILDLYVEFRDHHKDDPTGIESLKKVIGPQSLEEFEKDWRKWVLTLRFG